MAKIIFTDGREKEVFPKNGTDFQLEEMQGIVGGYIEVLTLNGAELMIVNEEGKLDGLAENDAATRIVRANGYDDFIVGNVLICKRAQVK